MDLEFTDDQLALGDAVRAVLEREATVGLARALHEQRSAPVDELWATISAALGWPAISLPKEAGGLGLGMVEVALIVEIMGYHLAPSPYLATVTQFAPIVRECTDPQRAAELLSGPAVEGRTGSLALAEQDGVWGTDAAWTTARQTNGGVVLDGEKHYVLHGATVDDLAVVACDAAGAPVVCLVPTTDVDVSALPTIDPTQPHATVHLAGVEVPGERVLATGERAAKAIERALHEAWAALACSSVGTCQWIFDNDLAYAKVREQFGVVIGTFQALKHRFANLYLAVERARSVAYFAALTIAQDDPRRAVASSMAKAAAAECQQLLVQDGLQLMGGIGFTWEHDLHLYLKRARSDAALLGSGEWHRRRVARLLGIAA